MVVIQEETAARSRTSRGVVRIWAVGWAVLMAVLAAERAGAWMSARERRAPREARRWAAIGLD